MYLSLKSKMSPFKDILQIVMFKAQTTGFRMKITESIKLLFNTADMYHLAVSSNQITSQLNRPKGIRRLSALSITNVCFK
jgi:hypothetical protein